MNPKPSVADKSVDLLAKKVTGVFISEKSLVVRPAKKLDITGN